MATGALSELTALRKDDPRLSLEKNPEDFVGEDGGTKSASVVSDGKETSWSASDTIVEETFEQISYVSEETSDILGNTQFLCLFICGVLVENVEMLAEAADTVRSKQSYSV